MPFTPHHVFFNGMLYWMARRRDDFNAFILTFDLTHEVFGEILLPDGIGSDKTSGSFIRTTGDSLFLIQEKDDFDDERGEWIRPICSMWILKQLGNSTSWIKIFSMMTNVYHRKILGVRNSGELILEMKDGHIYRYNALASTLLSVGDVKNSVFCSYHKESLFLLEKEKDTISY